MPHKSGTLTKNFMLGIDYVLSGPGMKQTILPSVRRGAMWSVVGLFSLKIVL